MMIGVIRFSFLFILGLIVMFLFYKFQPKKREAYNDPYLSLIHIEPTRVPLALDSFRGPSELQGISDASAALSTLSNENGLFIYGGDDQHTGLVISDAAILAHSVDSGHDLPLLIAPLSSHSKAHRSFFLLSLFNPSFGDPPLSLGHLVKNKQKFRIYCFTGLESSLFGVAWAVAGGGDVSQTSQVHILENNNAANLALTDFQQEKYNDTIIILPIWTCPESNMLKNIFSTWPSGHIASLSYHPKDESVQDGFLLETAPHMIKARAPALTASDVSIIRGSLYSSKSQTVLTAPSLVVVYPKNEEEESTLSMADALSDVLLNGKDPETSINLCAFYEAQGIPLLPRTEAKMREFDRKRAIEHFSDENLNKKVIFVETDFSHLKRDLFVSEKQSPVELVPVRSVPLLIRSEEGYDVATLLPHGSASVDAVKLRIGDRLILEKQESLIENGSWIVVKTVGSLPVLQKPVALSPVNYKTFLERSSSSPLIEPGWQWRFTLRAEGPASFLKEGDRIAWLPLKGMGRDPQTPIGTVVKKDKTNVEVVLPSESVVASSDASYFEKEWFHPLSRCLDADAIGYTLDTRQECKRKRGIMMWDRPCNIDTDCPNFQNGQVARRGRCLISGRCEEPVGVKPFAYRNVSSSFQAVCACPKEGSHLSLQAASHECCAFSDPVFAMQTL